MKKTIQNKKSKSKEYMEFWDDFKKPLKDIATQLKKRNGILEEMVETLKELKKK